MRDLHLPSDVALDDLGRVITPYVALAPASLDRTLRIFAPLRILEETVRALRRLQWEGDLHIHHEGDDPPYLLSSAVPPRLPLRDLLIPYRRLDRFRRALRATQEADLASLRRKWPAMASGAYGEFALDLLLQDLRSQSASERLHFPLLDDHAVPNPWNTILQGMLCDNLRLRRNGRQYVVEEHGRGIQTRAEFEQVVVDTARAEFTLLDAALGSSHTGKHAKITRFLTEGVRGHFRERFNFTIVRFADSSYISGNVVGIPCARMLHDLQESNLHGIDTTIEDARTAIARALQRGRR